MSLRRLLLAGLVAAMPAVAAAQADAPAAAATPGAAVPEPAPAPAPAPAENGAIAVELNKLEDAAGACRAYFVVRNGGTAPGRRAAARHLHDGP